MEFLKSVLGEELFGQVAAAVNAYNEKPENKESQVKLANLSGGQYVDKEKYNGAVAEKESGRTDQDLKRYDQNPEREQFRQ